jgi:hypothetical protein
MDAPGIGLPLLTALMPGMASSASLRRAISTTMLSMDMKAVLRELVARVRLAGVAFTIWRSRVSYPG